MAVIPPPNSSIFQYPPNFPNGQVSDAWLAYFASIAAGAYPLPAPSTGFAIGWDGAGNLVNVPNTGANQTAAWTAADAVVTSAFQSADLAAIVSAESQTLSNLAAVNGSSLVGYLAPYTGAVATTQAIQNGAVLSVSSFPSLAAAVGGIGAAKVTLIINTPVTVTADLTIPSNIDLVVQRSGQITVNSGFRLTINGTFSAPRLHQAFVSSLLTSTITASIYGNTLAVTASSSSVMAPGWVVTNANIATGSKIDIFNTASGGTGTYQLNVCQGTVASQSMSAFGPSVIFGIGAVEEVYPQWWGAVADTSTTDNGPAFAQAVMSMAWGGKVKFPAGSYKVATTGIVGHAGLTLEGDCNADWGTGAPPNSVTTHPTYIWLATDNSSLLCFSGLDSQVTISNITFGTLSTLVANPQTPQGTSRECIALVGHGPEFLYGLTVENCYFFNFDQAFSIVDPWTQNTGDGSGSYTLGGAVYNSYKTGSRLASPVDAYGDALLNTVASGTLYQVITVGTTSNWAACSDGTVTASGTVGTIGWIFKSNGTAPNGTGTLDVVANYFEWGVNPVIFRNSRFLFNQYGCLFSSNQIDLVRFEDCNFIPSNSGDGILIRRCGIMKLDNCFSTYYNGTANGNFFHIQMTGGAGGLANGNVTFDNCQAESIGNFLYFQTGDATTTIYPTFTVRNSTFQSGATITLSAPCEYIGQGNSVQAFIYIISTNVRVHSYSENFIWQNYVSGTTWGYSLAGGDAWSVQTMIPGAYPQTSYPNGIVRGIVSIYGTAAPAAGTWVTGDRCVRNPPVVGSPKAWTCTVAGTPGTWVSEGNL